jgi:hypothetical protein
MFKKAAWIVSLLGLAATAGSLGLRGFPSNDAEAAQDPPWVPGHCPNGYVCINFSEIHCCSAPRGACECVTTYSSQCKKKQLPYYYWSGNTSTTGECAEAVSNSLCCVMDANCSSGQYDGSCDFTNWPCIPSGTNNGYAVEYAPIGQSCGLLE